MGCFLFNKAGSNPNQVNHAGRTPLHEACLGGHSKVILILLDFTREVNIPDRDGQTPAHIAAANGEVQCLEILADKGNIFINQ